jgi:hypothetical protein
MSFLRILVPVNVGIRIAPLSLLLSFVITYIQKTASQPFLTGDRFKGIRELGWEREGKLQL